MWRWVYTFMFEYWETGVAQGSFDQLKLQRAFGSPRQVSFELSKLDELFAPHKNVALELSPSFPPIGELSSTEAFWEIGEL